MAKVASESIEEKCIEWYYYVKQEDLTHALLLKAEARRLLKKTKVNNKVIVFYGLIDYKHLMLEKRVQSIIAQERMDDENEPNLERLLTYLNHFINGQIHEKRQEWVSAAFFFGLAEQELKYITDFVERAEFFKQMELFYSSWNQMDHSRQYEEKYINELKGKESKGKGFLVEMPSKMH